MFIVQSEYDGDIFVSQVKTKLEALASARNHGLLGVLNAVQVQDKVQALDRVREAIRFILINFGRKRVRCCLPDADIRYVGNDYSGFNVFDFHVGPYGFTYYPVTGPSGMGKWQVCNT